MNKGKANFAIDMSHSKISSISGSINILDIIKKNNEEKKREKVQKIYALIGCGVGLVLIFGTFIYF